jgi:hypothetical protein
VPPPCQSGSRPPSKRPPPAVKEYAVTHLQSCFCPPLPTVAAAVARRHSPRSSSGLHLPFPAFAIAVARRHSCRCQLSLVAVIRPPRSLCRRPPACIALFAPPHGIITTDIITISSSHPVRSCCSSRCPPPALAVVVLDVIAITGVFVVVAPVMPLPLTRRQRRADSGQR